MVKTLAEPRARGTGIDQPQWAAIVHSALSSRVERAERRFLASCAAWLLASFWRPTRRAIVTSSGCQPVSVRGML